MTAGSEARRAARGRGVGWLGRAGLAGKGGSYLLVALLALQVAFGDEQGGPKDRQGALQTVAREPYGAFLVGLLGLSFAAYAIWRIADAVFERKRDGNDAAGLAKRAGQLARAALYGALATLCVTILLGASGGSGNENKEAARVLEWPGGRYLVAAVGLGFLAGAAYNLYRAITAKFMKELKKGEMDAGEEPTYRLVGRIGHAARGLVFGLVGFFLAKTAWQFDPKEAVGIDGALRKVATGEYGQVWLGVVAAGLGAYGLFCFVQARYRRV